MAVAGPTTIACDSARSRWTSRACRRAGDPLARAVGRRGAAVEAHRGLEQRERAPGAALVEVRRGGTRRRARRRARRRRRCRRRGAGRARVPRPSRRGRGPRSRPGRCRRRSAPRCRAGCCRGGHTARASRTPWRRGPGRPHRAVPRPRRAVRRDGHRSHRVPRSSPSRTITQPTWGHGGAAARASTAQRWASAISSSSVVVVVVVMAPLGLTRHRAPTGYDDRAARARGRTVALSHPDSHRRPRNLTSSARDWWPRVRGLPRSRRAGPWSPPVGTCTHTPRAVLGIVPRTVHESSRNWNTFSFRVTDGLGDHPGRLGRPERRRLRAGFGGPEPHHHRPGARIHLHHLVAEPERPVHVRRCARAPSGPGGRSCRRRPPHSSRRAARRDAPSGSATTAARSPR